MSAAPAKTSMRLRVGTRVQCLCFGLDGKQLWINGVVIRDQFRRGWQDAFDRGEPGASHPDTIPMVRCEDDSVTGGSRWPIERLRVVDNRTAV